MSKVGTWRGVGGEEGTDVALNTARRAWTCCPSPSPLYTQEFSRDQKGQARGKHVIDLYLRLVLVFLFAFPPLLLLVMLDGTEKKKQGGYFPTNSKQQKDEKQSQRKNAETKICFLCVLLF